MNNLDEITDNLYLGNYSSAEDITKLLSLGIKKVLSVIDQNWPNYGETNLFNHRKIKARDINSQNIIQYFGECINFIEGGEKVFVHCAAGQSRSATIVIAYIMWKKKMTFDKAYNFVKQKRPNIYPNFGFRQQLQMFEKLLFQNGFYLGNIYFKSIKWPSEHSSSYFSIY